MSPRWADLPRAVGPAAAALGLPLDAITMTTLTIQPSGRTIDAVTSVQASLHEMLCAIPVLETNIVHSHRHHKAILRAILDGRPDDAREAMEEHCDDTAALLRGFLG